MSNIFISLSKKFNLKADVLKSLFQQEENENIQTMLNDFLGQENQNASKKTQYQYCQFLIKLISQVSSDDNKQKLVVTLVYFLITLDNDKCLQILKKIKELKQSIVFRVKLFSLIFKSTKSSQIKKWLITNSLELIEKEPKTSYFTSFVQNFDKLMASVNEADFNIGQKMDLYFKFVSYLEKHIIYKKLRPIYMAKSLNSVNKQNANSDKVNAMIIKFFKANIVTDQALQLLNNPYLRQNKLYPSLECYLSGEFEGLNNLDKDGVEKAGISFDQLSRKIKINSIPRLFSSTKSASYTQVASILLIKKEQVQSYIIEAIQAGLVKAKLDQFQQTVLINRVQFKCLRGNEKVKVQKDLTATIERLQSI